MTEPGVKVVESVHSDGSHYSWVWRCPGCKAAHQCDDRWDFNGSRTAPSFLGKVNGPDGQREAGSVLVTREGSVCHSFVRDGRISFCEDSTHELRSQTVDLPDFGW